MSFKQNTGSGVQKDSFREFMKGVCTSVPGHVIVLVENQRAQIQVGIQRVDINGAEFELPPIIDVPVLFPGGDFCLEYQIEPGTEGLIHFSQRCTDAWKTTGGIAQNPIGRFHALQDAFFVPGFRSLPNALPSFSNNGIRLRNKAGTQYAWLKNDGSIDISNGAGYIRIGADGIVNINGATIDTDALIRTPSDVVWGSSETSGRGHVHSGVESGDDNSGPPV